MLCRDLFHLSTEPNNIPEQFWTKGIHHAASMR
jgi:uncharacterized protein YebE (UPF0316 family)